MQERLGIEEAIHQAGLDAMSLNVIESPLQFVRDTLDLLPTDTDDDWAAIGAYLGAVPQAMQEWHASLTHAAAQGLVASRRQVEGVLTQIDDLVAPDGTLAQLAKQGRDASPAAAQQLDDGIAAAVRGYGEARMWLVADILPRAGTIDAVGRDEYEMYSRRFLGTDIDVEETYAWGLAELERIQAEMSAVGARILPGATMPEVFAHLDADPRTPSRAPTRCVPGCRAAPTRPSPSSPAATSTSPSPCGASSAASPRRPPAASTTPARAKTSRAPVACGGPYPRASPASARGVS